MLLAAAMAFASLAGAQDPAQDVRPDGSISESLIVRETTIHVRVRTPRKAIEGLEQSRFKVLMGDRELPILAFEELATEATASSPAAATSADRAGSPLGDVAPAAGRSLLFVFDLFWTPKRYTAEAVQAARKNLRTLAPEDQVAVLILDTRAQLLHPFTKDRSVMTSGLDLLDAILDQDGPEIQSRVAKLQAAVGADETYSQSASLGLRGALGINNSRRLTVTALADPSLFANRPQARFSDNANDLFSITEAANVNALAQALQASNDSFAEAVRLVSDVPGPHYAFLLSTGDFVFRQLVAMPNNSRAALPAPGAGPAVMGSYQSLSYVLQAHGWTLQTIDVSGVGQRDQARDISTVPSLGNSQDFASIPDLALRGGLADATSDTLYFLAEETGGDFIHQMNNLGSALRKSLDATNHTYRLVVAAEGSEEFFDSRRTLKVQVSDLPRKARVTHSFSAEWNLPKNLRQRNAIEAARDQLLSGQGDRVLSPDSAQLGVFLMPGQGASRRALVVVDTTASALTSGSPGRSGERQLTALALALPSVTSKGSDAEFFDMFRLNSFFGRDNPTKRVVLVGDLIVPCTGANVRVRLSGADSYESNAILEHTIPDSCSEPLSWATPLVEADEDYFFAHEEGLDLDDPEQNPFRIEGTTAFPALRHMLERGQTLQLVTFSSSPNQAEPVQLLFQRDGMEAETLEPAETRAVTGQLGHLMVPLDLDGGRYSIRWGASPSAGGQIRVLDFSEQ